jgi:hypothetical protein
MRLATARFMRQYLQSNFGWITIGIPALTFEGFVDACHIVECSAMNEFLESRLERIDPDDIIGGHVI